MSDDVRRFESFLQTLDLGDAAHEPPDQAVTLAHPTAPSDELDSLGTTLLGVPVVEVDEEGEFTDTAQLRLTGTLGSGGMGVVWLAQQRALGREVAVKTLHAGEHSGKARVRLLREAWITGLLEHPNIVPVHTLGLDEDGAPMMVMKRIEGLSWRAAIEEPSRLPPRYQGMPTLEAHLRILIEVCDAIHFAHARGVIHRDLKPDNVMIDGFGGVYVVDWGIAVSFEAHTPDARLPLAAEVREPAGTPYYMAPEMAAGHGSQLGPHSDVFGLGAILHQLATGQHRFRGASFLQVLLQALRCEPFEYDPRAVDPALADICRRATEPDPQQRHPSAEALRADLSRFLELRHSRQVAAQAREGLSKLAAAIGAGRDHEVHQLFGACRFGFEQALVIWPENRRALRGLQRSLIVMAEFELDHERVEAAAHLLGEVGQPEPEVVERFERVKADVAQARAALQRLRDRQREESLGVFSRHRGVVVFALGLLWAGNAFRRDAGEPSFDDLLIGQGVMIALIAVLVFLARRWLWSTRVNRRLSVALFGVLGLDLLNRVMGLLLGLPVLKVAALETAVDFGAVLFIGLLIDRRLLAAALIYLATAIYAALNPSEVFLAVAWCNLLAVVLISAIWFRKSPDQFEQEVAARLAARKEAHVAELTSASRDE